MPWGNSFLKYIGKIVLILSTLPIVKLPAQALFYQDSLNKSWPIWLSGDTSKFAITTNGLRSTSTELNPHTYFLRLDCSPQTDSIYVEFDLDLFLNTSSQNRFQFGFICTDSANRFFSLGNTLDQLEYLSPESQQVFGPEKHLNTNTSQFKFILRVTHKVCSFHCIDLKNTSLAPIQLELPFAHLVRGFVWKITQNGKTAIGSHCLRNLVFARFPLVKSPNKIIQTNIINDTLFALHFEHPVDISINPLITLDRASPTNKFNWFGYHQLQIHHRNTKKDSLEIQIENLVSLNGTYLDTSYEIRYEFPRKPQYGDLAFSEVLYDALPSYGQLPEVEFIECFKRVNHPLQLQHTLLRVNQKLYSLPAFDWNQDSFLIITPNASAFPGKSCIEVPFNLTNTENIIAIYDATGNLIDSVNLHQKQQLPIFQDGGWSIATTHPPTPLSSKFSWQSHGNSSGSPGGRNNLDSNLIRSTNLNIHAIQTPGHLLIQFSEQLSPKQWIYIDQDSVFYERGTALQLEHTKTNKDSVWIRYTHRNQRKYAHQIPLWEMGQSQVELSEVWFEAPENADFVELRNSGNKALNLSDMDLLIFQPDPKILTQIIPLIRSPKPWLCPGEIIVITQNPFYLYQQFPTPFPENILSIDPFPNLQTNGGSIEIVHHLFGRLDKIEFHRDMHVNEQQYDRSIEKKASGLSGKYRENWISYLSLEHKSSPGIWEHFEVPPDLNEPIKIEKRIWFVGREIVKIPVQFKFPEPGFQVFAYLFDLWGNPLGKIINGAVLPQKGIYYLTLDEFPMIPKNGNYVVKFEAQHIPSQTIIRYLQRLTFVHE